jgi:hypothetical protein
MLLTRVAVPGTAAPRRTMTGVTHSGVQRKTGIKDRRSRYRSVASAERTHVAPRAASREVRVKEESIHSSDQEMQRLMYYVLCTMRRQGRVGNVSSGLSWVALWGRA